MEILFGALAGTAGASAGAAGAAATGGALAGLASAGSVFSAIAQIGTGIVGLGAAATAAKQQKFEATEEFISGKETSAALKKELAVTLGNQAVAFAAGGANLGSVSVQAAKKQAIHDAEVELSIAGNTALSRHMAKKRQARNTMMRGVTDFAGSLIGAGSDLFADRRSLQAIG
jgi:hypothetical protein